jgi:hypothetical protein
MATTINGWVEVKRATWDGSILLDSLLPPVSTMFGCLFGVNNVHNFKPIAHARGIPIDISAVAKKDSLYRMGHSHTWLDLPEINRIDWEEDSLPLDHPASTYRLNAEGQWQLTLPLRQQFLLEYDPNAYVLESGILHPITRCEDLNRSRWQLIFDLMNRIAQVYGEENVRIVASFDS